MVAQVRRGREFAALELSMMHAVGNAVASIIDKKGAASYKAAESVLIGLLEGGATVDQRSTVEAVAQRLLQAGARRKHS